ncbi:MAG: hypothetical protein Q9169_007418 [Polycauliona sp. 2 TL-2023]
MDNNPLVEPEASKAHSQAHHPPPPPPLIIKADELDAIGTDVTTPVSDISTPITPALQAPQFPSAQSPSNQNLTTSPKPVQVRPILRREGSTRPPPSEAPPPALSQPQQQGEDVTQLPTDSLSLQQLRRLVTEFPKLEPQAYAYDHTDTRSFAEEVEEWFPYSEEEKYLLLRGKETFEAQWQKRKITDGAKRNDVNDYTRKQFVHDIKKGMTKGNEVEVVECLAYLALGCWGDTAGLKDETEESEWSGIPAGRFTHSAAQIRSMRRGCEVLAACQSFETVFRVFHETCDSQEEDEQDAEAAPMNEADLGPIIMDRYVALNQCLTVMYMMIEVARWGPAATTFQMRKALSELEPDLLQYLTQLIAKTRWQDAPWLPFTRLLLLYWKALLLLFGGSEELQNSKEALKTENDVSKDEHDEGFITATPLDYHLFRQEITSKYPAYNPPPPLLPIELENNSILPPLPNHPSRQTSQENLRMASDSAATGTPGSIFYQPVHIATPAPSPPPSPAGPGGKGGKKQNYQTNQNFPFLYPPPDPTSNVVGGKGNAGLQDQLVGKRWEGSDVPASILEAGQLFASRMRMSRSIRQLWEVREQYIRHERGWNEVNKGNASPDSDGSVIEEDESDEPEEKTTDSSASGKGPKDERRPETQDEEVQRRLDAIETFYRNALPHLQSLVLVLWKIVFTNVSYLVTQVNGQNGLAVPNGISFPDDNLENGPGKRKANPNAASQEGIANGNPAEFEHETDPAVEELNAIRLREISTKAISAILVTLLRWFKLSHILKFEYLTQLLLDANYLPLILKLFAHQDVDRAVDQKNDRDDLNFFHFCHLNSTHPPSPSQQNPPSPTSSPSPSLPTRDPNQICNLSPQSSPHSPNQGYVLPPPGNHPKPTVDELGYPTAPLPSTPLTTYSPRFFHTTTTLLSLLQKITSSHAHRSLLLVQYKSSTILRKYLKIPQPQLRRGVLKLFKQQVMFCGRKWRQGNMRVITSVYLHLGMRGLRDEWLSGGDVDGVVEEAVPVECAWRGLVGWWHLKGYRDVVEGLEGLDVNVIHGVGDGSKDKNGDGDTGKEDNGVKRMDRMRKGDKEEDEYDFFTRELEKMGWGVGGGGDGVADGIDEDEDEASGMAAL